MPESNSISCSWGGSNAASLSGTDTPTANSLQSSSFTAGNLATTEVDLVFAYAELKSVYILSDKDLTLKTNSSGSPDQTFALKANVPFAWSINSGIPNPFNTNNTKFYFVNAGETDASVSTRILHNI